MTYLYIAAIAIVVIVTAYFGWAAALKKRDEKKTEEHVLAFIKNNPDKASMYAYVNGNTFIDYQSHRNMPLASTVKIMIAIEYAKQVTSNKIDANERVPLNHLDKYYIPNTDGNAHPSWLTFLPSQAASDGCVSIHEVVCGMIAFSSNANMEYLIDYLGLDNINRTIEQLQLDYHDPLFFLSSSFLLPFYMKEKEKWKRKELNNRIKQMPYKKYMEHAQDIQHFLKHASPTERSSAFHRFTRANLELQRIMSCKLPCSTTKDYATLMKRLHLGDGLCTAQICEMVRTIMNRKLSPHSKFSYLGSKGGSTISIYNDALFSKDIDGNTFDLALFFHDFSEADEMWLNKKIDLFLHKFLVDPAFRQKVADTLAP